MSIFLMMMAVFLVFVFLGIPVSFSIGLSTVAAVLGQGDAPGVCITDGIYGIGLLYIPGYPYVHSGRLSHGDPAGCPKGW